MLFIATNFLFKRALLLCVLSRFCRYCLTSSLDLFPVHSGKNVMGVDGDIISCECAPSLEIKKTSPVLWHHEKKGHRRNAKNKQTNISAPEIHRRSNVQPYASKGPIFLLGMTALQSDALLSVTFHHHPDHLRPPTSLPPPTQGRSGREFLITSASASLNTLHVTSAAYWPSAAASIWTQMAGIVHFV